MTDIRPKVGPGQLFVGGHWRPTAEQLDVLDPSTGRVVTTVFGG